MKKIIILIAALLLAFLYSRYPNLLHTNSPVIQPGNADITTLYRNRQSNVQVTGQGIVRRVLRDDQQGRRHQKFILSLPTGQSLLVAHNIDLAPRINSLRKGDEVSFFGEYEWNEKGGILHWTHKAPHGHHVDGWLRHKGKIYQ
ncbi:MAG TPA: DUF3465 domain-containing protein [Desulfobulbaceae bacterium]|nr:DUF3465 domain-containing protein [Desulfobulbaceae bacterium]